MLSSISPFGERSRNNRWWLTASAYIAGSVAGGATTGVVFGLIGEAIAPQPEVGLAILAAAGVMGLAADLGVAGARLPSWHRQVNEDWLATYRGWVYGLGFGFQLGLSWATIVTTSAVWLTWLAVVLAGSWSWGLVVGAFFGLVRGSLIFAAVHVDDPSRLRALFRSIETRAPSVQRAAVVAVGLVAVTAMGGLVS